VAQDLRIFFFQVEDFSMKKCLLNIGALLFLVMIAPPVQATVMSPGDPPATITGIAGLPAGSIISNGGNVSVESFTALDAQGHVRYQGTLYYAVYREAATGYLDFLYQIQNSKKSHDAITRVTTIDFSSAAGYIDATYLKASAPSGFLSKGTRAPSTGDLSDDGSVVGFNFPAGSKSKRTDIGPGITTDVFVVRTHNTGGYRPGSTSTIGGATVTVGSFAPGPEPSTLVLFAGCFLGLAGWAGWRRWKGGSVSV
jgi:hypothetical protein